MTTAVSMSLRPRNNPPAAISFTSPPPNAPLVITAIISNGVLTHRTSNMPDAKASSPRNEPVYNCQHRNQQYTEIRYPLLLLYIINSNFSDLPRLLRIKNLSYIFRIRTFIVPLTQYNLYTNFSARAKIFISRNVSNVRVNTLNILKKTLSFDRVFSDSKGNRTPDSSVRG